LYRHFDRLVVFDLVPVILCCELLMLSINLSRCFTQSKFPFNSIDFCINSFIVAFALSIIPLDWGFPDSLNICLMLFSLKKFLNLSFLNLLPLSLIIAQILDCLYIFLNAFNASTSVLFSLLRYIQIGNSYQSH
jgi:hypothetical protein